MPDERHRGGFTGPRTIDSDEIEANMFAMMLLMPEMWLRRDCQALFAIKSDGRRHGKRGGSGRFDIEDDPRIRGLADRYQVSVQLMTLRLIDLGLF